MVPKTHLLIAPHDADSSFGVSMSSTDIIRGLRRINNNITVPMPEHYARDGWFYPLQSKGITCIWLGPPGKGGKKITAFKCGVVPEFTQKDEYGLLICKGWRAVFEKVIKARAATKAQLAREFKVDLDLDQEAKDPRCKQCIREGIRCMSPDPRASSASGLCNFHDEAMTAAAQGVRLHQDKPLRQKYEAYKKAKQPVIFT